MASKYGQNDYSLLGKAKIDVSNIENDTNKIVSNLEKIDKKAKEVQNSLSNVGGDTGSAGKKSRVNQETIMEIQKWSKELNDLKDSYKAGDISLQQYTKDVKKLQQAMRDTGKFDFLEDETIGTKALSAEQKRLLVTYDKVNKAVVSNERQHKILNGTLQTGTKALKAQDPAILALILNTNKYGNTLDGLKNKFKAGDISAEDYKKELLSLQTVMSGDVGAVNGIVGSQKLTTQQTALMSVNKRLNSELATVTATIKKQDDSMSGLASFTQRCKTKLDDLNSSYRKSAISTETYYKELKKLQTVMNGTGNNLSKKSNTSSLNSTEQEFVSQWKDVNTTLEKTSKSMLTLGKSSGETGMSVRKTIQALFGWDLARQGIFYIVQYFGVMLNTLKDINTYIINIQKVTNQSDSEMKAVQGTASEIASTLGRLTTDYLEALEAFSRLKDVDAEQFAEMALLLQNVGDVTAEVSQETLIATNNGFQLNGSYEELMKTIDAMNEISNNNATTITKMSEAIKVSASTAGAAGLTFNEYIALVGTATAVTQREGSQIGNAMRTMFLTLEQVTSASDNIDTDKLGKAATAIKSFGIDMTDEKGELRGVYEILNDVSGEWDTLSKNQKMYFAQSVGNKRQADIILGIMNNWEMVQHQYELAEASAGSAKKENETYMKSWQAHINTLISTLTDKGQEIISSDSILFAVDSATKLVDVLGEITPALLAITAAYQTLNKESAFHKITSATKGGLIGNLAPDLMKNYATNLALAIEPSLDFSKMSDKVANSMRTVAVETVNSEKTLGSYALKAKAMGGAVASSISPITALTLGLTAAITIYSAISASIKDNYENTKERFKQEDEDLKQLNASFNGTVDSFKTKLQEYYTLEDKYSRDSGSLTIEEFKQMTTLGGELQETLTGVGMSFDTVAFSSNKVGESFANIEDKVNGITDSFEQAFSLTTLDKINQFSDDLFGSTTTNGRKDFKLNNFDPIGQYIDMPNLFLKSGNSEDYKDLEQAFTDYTNILYANTNGAELDGRDNINSVFGFGDSDSISDTITRIKEARIEYDALYKSELLLSGADDDLTKDYLKITTSLATLEEGVTNYLKQNYYMVDQIDTIRKYLGDEALTQETKDLYNTLKAIGGVTSSLGDASASVSDVTGNKYSKQQAVGSYTSSLNTTDEDAKAQAEEVVNSYIEAVEEYQKKLEALGNKKFSLGDFSQADEDLVKTRDTLESLIHTYLDYQKIGNQQGMDAIMEYLSSYGIDDIETAITGYNQLANATKDLSTYTKDLAEEDAKQVEELVGVIDGYSTAAQNAQDLAIAYINLKDTAGTDTASQIELRKAYDAVTSAMGLQADESTTTENAILSLATANSSLTDADKQRIISNASVSESAKQTTLTILKARKQELMAQLEAAKAAQAGGQGISDASTKTANNVTIATDVIQRQWIAVKGVMDGSRVTPLKSGVISSQSVSTGDVENLQRQIANIDSLIATVGSLTTTVQSAAKDASGSASNAASDVASTIKDTISNIISDTSDGLDQIVQNIKNAYDKGSINAKEAYGRITNEISVVQDEFDAIMQRPKSQWTEIESSIVEHYNNLISAQADYLKEIQSNYDDATSKVESLQGTIVSALQKKYEQLRQDRIDQINEERDAEVSLYDTQIENLKKQIEDLQDETEEKTKNLESLKKKLDASRSDTSVIGKKRTADLEKEVADLTKELAIKTLEDQEKELEDQKTAREDYYDSLIDQDSEYYDSTLANLDSALKESNLYAEANALIISKNTQGILDLLTSYAPDYSGIGQLLGKSLADTMTETITTGLNALDLVYEGTATTISSYVAQSQAWLNQANAQIAQLEGKLKQISETGGSGGSYSGGGGSSDGGGSSGVITPVVDTQKENIKLLQGYLNTYFKAGLVIDGIAGEGSNTRKAIDGFIQKSLGSSSFSVQERAYLKAAMDSNTYNDTVAGYLKRYYGRTPNTSGTFRYLEGGLNTQTGLAYLDGTTQKPERILPSNVTRTFDDFVYKYLPRISVNFDKVNNNQKQDGNGASVVNNVEINNTINTPFDGKKMYKQVEDLFTNSIRRSGINP